MGGSVLLRFLGDSSRRTDESSIEDGDESARESPLGILGAVTVSAPLDLSATSKCLGRPSRWVYQQYLLSKMRSQALHEDAELTAEERKAVKAARSIWAFDETFTAPRCGFDDVNDYYESYSAKSKLAQIDVPTLLNLCRG